MPESITFRQGMPTLIKSGISATVEAKTLHTAKEIIASFQSRRNVDHATDKMYAMARELSTEARPIHLIFYGPTKDTPWWACVTKLRKTIMVSGPKDFLRLQENTACPHLTFRWNGRDMKFTHLKNV